MKKRMRLTAAGVAVLVVSLSSSLIAQGDEQAQPTDQRPTPMPMDMTSAGWRFMQDASLNVMFNHQGGPRGGDELKAPNWWMGMATRKLGSSQLTFNAMLSLDPATVGRRGYSEILQVGETLDGAPLIDRQHPHDLFMQLAAIWRAPIASTTGLTVAGGPVGEPALGPIAFMHRASAAEYPLAPLSHHTFDSTHVAFGVVSVAVDHGPWIVEGSLFNAREPDEYRWDFDFGRLDSVSARVWFRPGREWEFQTSTGRLKHPEALAAGDIQRTTASGSWFRPNGGDFTAVTAGYGINVTDAGNRQAVFGEATRRAGLNSIFGRVEIVQVETDELLYDAIPTAHDTASRTDLVGAFTLGGVRDVLRWQGFEGGIGAGVTFYALADSLKTTHGDRPVSFQVFFRIRPPAGTVGRMWNMRMSQPMLGHQTTMDHGMN